MHKTQKLDTNLKITYKQNPENFLNPEQIVIPLPPNQLPNVSLNDQVYKDTELYPQTFSPISGRITSITPNIITIQNDFTEQFRTTLKATKQKEFTPQELQNILNQYGFTNKKFIQSLNTPIDFIIINGIDEYPYQKNNTTYFLNQQEKLLSSCEILQNSLKPKHFFITFKNTDNENIELFSNSSGSYPFITYRYLNDEYPLNNCELLCTKLSISPQNTIYLTAEQLLEFHTIVKRRRPYTEKYITIASDQLTESFVLETKIGTPLTSLIKKYHLPFHDVTYIENNLLYNHIIDPTKYIITNTTKGIYIIKNETPKTYNCISCGKCNEVCPYNLNPLNKNDLEKCQKCGLCTYFCPANIKLGRNK